MVREEGLSFRPGRRITMKSTIRKFREEFALSDGSALLLAIQEWLTPDGHTIWHRGINPDIVVGLPPLAFPLLPASISGLTPEGLWKTEDAQLLRALHIISKAAANSGIKRVARLLSTSCILLPNVLRSGLRPSIWS